MRDLEVAHDRVLWRSGQVLRRTEQQYILPVPFQVPLRSGMGLWATPAVAVTISAAAMTTSLRIFFLLVMFCVEWRWLARQTLGR
jgi:hypothetical protein